MISVHGRTCLPGSAVLTRRDVALLDWIICKTDLPCKKRKDSHEIRGQGKDAWGFQKQGGGRKEPSLLPVREDSCPSQKLDCRFKNPSLSLENTESGILAMKVLQNKHSSLLLKHRILWTHYFQV